MFQCNQCNCGAEATHAFRWPGHRLAPICTTHVQMGIRIAEVMGFTLDVRDINELVAIYAAEMLSYGPPL